MTTTTRRTRSRRGEGDKLRNEILQVAERLFVQAGNSDDVSVRAIADAVGCTPPSIYLHFSDKDELFYAICSQRFEEFDRFVHHEVDPGDDPLQSLKVRGRAYIRFGLEHPEHYKLLMMVPKTRRASELAPDAPGIVAFEHLVGAVQRCIDEGSISGEHGATQIALALWSACHGITALLITFGNFEEFIDKGNANDVIELLLDVQLEGLLAI